MDKISIITVTYNCCEDIESTMLSVFEQDYHAIEYIIIDGASTDGTVSLIEKHRDKVDYFVSEPDKGLYYAMNKGIAAATGDWIYILNSGCQLHDPHAISRVFENNLKNYDAVFGYTYEKHEKRYRRNFTPFYCQSGRFKVPGYSHQALFVRREKCLKYLFDTTFRCCADFNQAMSLYNEGSIFHSLDLPIAKTDASVFSANNRLLQFKETAIINKIENSYFYRIIYMRFFVRYILKKLFSYIR